MSQFIVSSTSFIDFLFIKNLKVNHRRTSLPCTVVLASLIFGSFQAFSQAKMTKTNFQAPYGVEVNTWNGNLFYDRTDLRVAAEGRDIIINFAYNSRAAMNDNGFGKGWNMNYDMSYNLSGSDVTIHMPDGRLVQFTWTGSTYSPPSGNFATRWRRTLSGAYPLRRPKKITQLLQVANETPANVFCNCTRSPLHLNT